MEHLKLQHLKFSMQSNSWWGDLANGSFGISLFSKFYAVYDNVI